MKSLKDEKKEPYPIRQHEQVDDFYRNGYTCCDGKHKTGKLQMVSLRLWVEMGVYPSSSFLRAILDNDLSKAFGYADSYNRENLHAYVMFLYNYAPGDSWGKGHRSRWSGYANDHERIRIREELKLPSSVGQSDSEKMRAELGYELP
jgi:hypothetical protein